MRTKNHGNGIVEITDDNVLIKDIDDVFSLLFANNCSKIIRKENMIDDFFDLSTGIAGEILQKFSTYHKGLAILGEYTGVQSKPLKHFIRVVQKLQFLNNNRLKTAKCGALKPTGFLAGLVREPTGFLNKSIYESNRMKQIIFVKTAEEAVKIFTE